MKCIQHSTRWPAGFLVGLLLLGWAGCGKEAAEEKAQMEKIEKEVPMTIDVTSSAFKKGAAIPQKYTADGENISPPIEWTNLPKGTKQLALIVDDPDAPAKTPFVHWVIYGMPETVTGLPENVPNDSELTEPTARQGINGFKKTGYGGPAPPKGGGVHHYHFRLYALDEALDLEPELSKQGILKAVEGHMLAQGELLGTYER